MVDLIPPFMELVLEKVYIMIGPAGDPLCST